MQYLGKNDLSKVFRAAYEANTPKSQLHHQAMLIAFFCGTRISQVLNVRGEDIFEKDGKYVIMIRAAKRGNAVTHSLHFDDDPAFDMSPLIELARVKGQSKIFGGLTRQFFNLCLKKYGVAAGIHSSYLHSHCLRHSIAILIFDATKRIGSVSQFLGHKSASAAYVYLAENNGLMAQDAVDNISFACASTSGSGSY